jgi:hypothetical protein
LLRQYIDELRTAKPLVNAWWSRLVAAQLARTPDQVTAAAELQRRWPAGPAAHPRVLAIVRKYYLACDGLNRQLRRKLEEDSRELVPHFPDGERQSQDDESDDRPVNPAAFVGETLVSPDTADLAKIVAKLSYWPIGIDSTGAYV